MSASAVPSLPYIIDVEASGFGRGSYPIEVGFIDPDGQTQARLIHPLPDWQHWSEDAEAIHGLSRADLLAQGQPVKTVALWLNSQLQGQTVYSDSWGFDSSWLALLFDRAGMHQRFKVDALARLLNEAQLAVWEGYKQEVFRREGLVRHRAADDASALQQTLRLIWAAGCAKTPV